MGILSKIKNVFRRKKNLVPRKSYSEIVVGLVILPKYLIQVKLICDKFNANRERYEVVSSATGVPADVIFACHYRESSLDFKGALHNGERIIGTGKLTRLVPKGHGPFVSWEEAAIDALKLESRKFPAVWDLIGKLEFCERYNGMGYKNHGMPSPYVLSWTNEYTAGKYVADGKFDPDFVDKQCGTAAIILGLSK